MPIMDDINTSLPFDPFAMPFGYSDPTLTSDYTPISFFGAESDFTPDFASDSDASPTSPISPVLSASSYGFPSADDWNSWDHIEHSPGPDSLFPPEGTFMSSRLNQKVPLSPAINPMDLTLRSNIPTMEPPKSRQSSVRPNQPTEIPVSQPRRASGATIKSETTEQNDLSLKRYPSRGLKRKSSTSGSEEEEQVEEASQPATKRTSPTPAADRKPAKERELHPKKTAHNMIEKRYRNNLNDKITQLRDAVPSLRIASQRLAGRGASSEEEGFMDDNNNEYSVTSTAVPKLNKATILSKATDYIMQLETRNRTLETENSALRGRMEGLEMLLMARGGRSGVWN